MVTKILDELDRENVIKDMCTNMRINPNDVDDLIQEIYVILLEYDPKKIVEMYNKKQLRFFIVGVLKRQYNSKTSPFYKKYKKYYTIIDGNYVNNENNNMDDAE